MPELKKNILNFGYGFNFKYEGMLSHPFDRFFVVKIYLLTIEDGKFLLINFDSGFNYLKVYLGKNRYPVQHVTNIRNLSLEIVPFVHYYKEQIDAYNKTVWIIFLNFQKNKRYNYFISKQVLSDSIQGRQFT